MEVIYGKKNQFVCQQEKRADLDRHTLPARIRRPADRTGMRKRFTLLLLTLNME